MRPSHRGTPAVFELLVAAYSRAGGLNPFLGCVVAVPLNSIVRIQRGQHTSGFARYRKLYYDQAHLSFSIICDGTCANGRQSLDLIALSVEDCEKWCVLVCGGWSVAPPTCTHLFPP